MWLKYGLKAQKLQKQHALKGQKLLAQGVWGKTCESSVTYKCRGNLSLLRDTDLFCRNKDFNNENSYKSNYSYRL